MKKRIVCLLLICACLLGLLVGCGAKLPEKKNAEGYAVEMAYKDGFTVLQLTDIHWHGGSDLGDDDGSRGYMKKVIDEAVKKSGGIDLIEITGDTFMLAEKSQVTSFIDFMEETGIPYAITWGNHDREGKYNANWLSKQFINAEHSLYVEIEDDVPGRCNYMINLKKDGKVFWQLCQLDSGASYRKGAGDLGLDYDYIRPEQYDWMTAEHGKVGADVPMICYYHIAQKEVGEAYEAITSGASDCKQGFFKLEGFAESSFADSTTEVFKKNNVKAAFMGHAHAVDWTYTSPDGIVYGFGVKTGTELYYGHVAADDAEATKNCGFKVTEDFDLIGASLVTLHDSDFTLEHLYLNEREDGDFVLWVKY